MLTLPPWMAATKKWMGSAVELRIPVSWTKAAPYLLKRSLPLAGSNSTSTVSLLENVNPVCTLCLIEWEEAMPRLEMPQTPCPTSLIWIVTGFVKLDCYRLS